MTTSTTSLTGERLAAVRAEGRAALVGYLPVGFPDTTSSVAAGRAMIDAGVDVVELGVPYSDPVMDGTVIQAAVEHALAGGVRVADTLRTVAHATPHAWAAQALAEVQRHGAGLVDILPELGVLLGFAAVLLLVGAWTLRRSLARAI